MLHSPSTKCMQQIAILIITFAVYVAGIRNTGNAIAGDGKVQVTSGGGNVGAIADYESYSAPYNEDFRPSQLLSEVTEVISTATDKIERRQSNTDNTNFRPSQIISFTPSDAQSTLKTYPPSYLEPNYHAQHISKGGPYGLAAYNKDDKQFAFPRETDRPVAAALVSNNANIEKYLYSSAKQQQTTTQQTLVPAQLHTTPILIYRDPYTNKINTSQRQQAEYRPGPPPEPIYQQTYYGEASRPQEYTVQSMLVVGAEHSSPIYNQQRPQFGLEGGENKRPGYVFDEQVRPSYNQPVYTSNRYEVGVTSTPTSIVDYNRRDGETQTERPFEGKLGVSPSTATKISYDSHDYPPPSYYKQQTSNFQSPQRQDNSPNYQQQSTYVTETTPAASAIKTGRPELTSSNYANNKFGNYLQGGKGGDGGYYKRPPPHYSNDILYVTPAPPTAPARPPTPVRPSATYYPQGNEPIRRPPTYDNNYNQYQLGEIPPPQTLQSALNSGPRPPPTAEQYPTPQRYPSGPNYQSPQSFPSSQNYPPSEDYASPQNYAPLQSYPAPQQYPPPPNYRPLPPAPPQYQRPQQPSTAGGMGGLATLASFFTGTQQYAPQFTNLLLGGNGGGGGLLHALTGTRPLGGGGGGGRPPNMQLIKALENIARNDDLECVPKVLCNMIASQTQRGQLPGFVTSPAITNFLAGFPAQSPALIYGRAALLGISGGERSCTQTYAKCPKNEYEILYYLNNHRGGFFKFFSEAEEQKPTQQSQQSQSSTSSGGTSLFSLLSALTGADPPVTTTTPRPTPPPTVASFDITQGIGNFFSNILSEYISGVEYQRRSSRTKRSINFEDERQHNEEERLKFPTDTESEDFHDEEDDEDTQGGVDFEDEERTSEANENDANESAEYGDTQARVVFKSGEHETHFFPENEGREIDERLKDIYLQEVINKFNSAKSERKLKFPAETDSKVEASVAYDEAVNAGGGAAVHFRDESDGYTNESPSSVVNFRDEENPSDFGYYNVEQTRPTRRGKAVVFENKNDNHNYAPLRQPREEFDVAYEPQSGKRVIFPDHYEKHIRKGKILNNPILYASNYADYTPTAEADRFVVSDSHRPEYNGIAGTEDNSVNYDDKPLGPIYITATSTQQQNTLSNTNVQVYNDNRLHYNRGADTYRPSRPTTYYDTHSSSANYNSNRYSASNNAANQKRRPYYGSSSSSSSSNHYDYPNKNYVSNNRYGSRYTTTTRSPRGSDNDHNIYVTNAQGVTTHYITPDGRKIYL
uniref:Uncharacterized protein n=1 Tax=Zeugodacus cucurbitae TaxID=28588 RepID=A0A0A1WSX2_ZEUCU